ncbi:hypothetical protein RJT34_12212 [Clitoria ternatea]|uniref:LysM domain-containing protein n=1 Tax=Clitoria ternatea TaxID=43366 RepID=A0AAN9JND7_CLITE
MSVNSFLSSKTNFIAQVEMSAHYRTRHFATLYSIADSICGGLVSSDQLREANSIADPSVLDAGQNLVLHIPPLTDLMDVNDMGTTAISDGDILAVLRAACASNFPEHASDLGLLVPHGSYAITANHCVQCSCRP